jgi:hypothetical protein
MTLLSRVSVIGTRSCNSARSQLSLCKVVNNSAKSPSLSRSVSTEPSHTVSSNGAQSRLGGIANILRTTLVGAGSATVYFTYLRFKDSGLGVAANTIMDDGLHPAKYPWPNDHPFATFDHARYAVPSPQERCAIDLLWIVCDEDIKSIGRSAPHAILSTALPGAILSA